MSTTKDARPAFAAHGVEFTGETDTQWIGTCPVCGKHSKFYINKDSGLWDCKVCAASGNQPQFLEWRDEAYRAAITPKQRRTLARERGLPLEAIPSAFGYDEQRRAYTTLIRNPQGVACDIQRFGFLSERDRKPQWYGTAGCHTGLFNGEALRVASPGARVWTCEGGWDAIALAHRLQQAGRTTGRDVVVGVPGMGTFKAEWVPLFRGHDIRLLYDAGEQAETAMTRAAKKLHPVARRVRLLAWPEDTKANTDIRDFIRATADEDPQETVRALVGLLVAYVPDDEDDEGDDSSTENHPRGNRGPLRTVDAMTDAYVFCEEQERFGLLADPTDKPLTELQFRRRHARYHPMRTNPADVSYHEHPKAQVVDSIAYVPGAERLADTVIDGRPVRVLNIWIPSPTVPVAAAPGALDWYHEHLAVLFPEETDRTLYCDWMATVARDLTLKPSWHPAIWGPPGCGKDASTTPLRFALGPYNVGEPTGNDLTERFNDHWLGHHRLVIVDVQRLTGEPIDKIFVRLSATAASPPPINVINPKYGKQYVITNLHALIAFANSPKGLAIDDGDRRWWVFHTPAPKLSDGEAKRLWNRARASAAGLAHWLLREYVISEGFNIQGPAPMTDAKQQVVRAREPELVQRLRQMKEERTKPLHVELIAVTDVQKHFALQPLSPRSGALTAHAVGDALKALGATELKKVKLSDGTQRRVWAIAHADHYHAMSYRALADEYERQRKVASSFRSPTLREVR